MPSRQFHGREPFAIARARELARQGMTANQIASELMEQYEDIPSSRLERIASQERDRDDRLNTLAEMNWGTFQNLLRATNCPQGSTGFQINLTIHGNDPETGNPRSYNQTVRVEGARTVTQLLTEAVRKVIEDSTLSGSAVEGPSRVTRETVASQLTFHYIDCY